MMRRFSLLVKLFMGNLLLVGVVIAVGLTVSYRHLNTSYMRNNRRHQDNAIELSRRYFQDLRPMSEPRIKRAMRAMKRLFADSEMRLTVIASDGRVLGDSIAEPAGMDNHKTADRPEVLAAIEGKNGTATRLSRTTQIEYRYVTRPVKQEETVVMLVRLAMPIRTIAEDQALIRNALFWTMLATVGVAVAMALLMSWIWYSPLKKITSAAEQLAAGNLDARIQIGGADELATLAGALNGMRESLSSQIRDGETQRRQLRSVVDNLREGVVALDKTGHVLLINTSATDLLALDTGDITGREFKSVVTGGGVLDLYHKLMAAGEFVNGQTAAGGKGGRIMDVHAARVAAGTPDGIAVLLVLRDVTEVAGAAAMKAEFVANASHELRTPLATIRAASEALADAGASDPDVLTKVATILDRHITRLEHMTNDLLSLHLVETPGTGPDLTDVSAASLIDRIREDHGDQAASKQVELVVSSDPADFTFASDTTLLQLIIDNLVGNAMKFTPAGGKVACTLTEASGEAVLKVADTGCGIPPEMHDRVFERFFQAQTSRSGDAAVRGTGLGLAIVKHAADRLGGKVDLTSKPGEGTTVTITLPQARRGG